MERVMFAFANFVGMEFNTFSFVGSSVYLFIYIFSDEEWLVRNEKGTTGNANFGWVVFMINQFQVEQICPKSFVI